MDAYFEGLKKGDTVLLKTYEEICCEYDINENDFSSNGFHPSDKYVYLNSYMKRFLGGEYTITDVTKREHEYAFTLNGTERVDGWSAVEGWFWSDWMIKIPTLEPIEEIKEGEQNGVFEMLFL